MAGRIRRGDLDLALEPGETVLDGLLRSGVNVASSCRAGACQACMLRAKSGDPGPQAREGLSPALREQGWFLSCVARPTGELVLADGAPPAVGAEVVEVSEIGRATVRVLLAPDEPLSYRPGQYVQVIDGDVVRAYSLAGLPDEGPLELHVRVHPEGRMSRMLAGARPGRRLSLRGPAGACFYTEGQPAQPLLLVGTGTGLAPLRAIARDARRRGHTGPMVLIHGARDPGGFYLVDELKDMARTTSDFRYVRCAMSGEPEEGLEIGDLVAALRRLIPSLIGWRVFLCGDPGIVHTLKKQCFLRGASMREILADAFLTAAPPTDAATPPAAG